MLRSKISSGVVHSLPSDLSKALEHRKAVPLWNDLTPLARNEWICWIISVKTPETRKDRIKRACNELLEGKRRPCCWPGCPHRNPKAKKWFKNLK